MFGAIDPGASVSSLLELLYECSKKKEKSFGNRNYLSFSKLLHKYSRKKKELSKWHTAKANPVYVQIPRNL